MNKTIAVTIVMKKYESSFFELKETLFTFFGRVAIFLEKKKTKTL